MAYQITISIDTTNAAFDDDARSEVARILRTLADQYENEGLEYRADVNQKLRDINGNTIGLARVADIYGRR